MTEKTLKLAYYCDWARRFPEWKSTPILDAEGNQEIDADGNPKLKTFCNIATYYVASKLGCDWFKDRMANDIVDCMASNPFVFNPVLFRKASELANAGELVIAGQKGEEHGHVAILYPMDMQFSPTFNGDVPMVSNVGNKNEVMRLSQAFKLSPYPQCWHFSG